MRRRQVVHTRLHDLPRTHRTPRAAKSTIRHTGHPLVAAGTTPTKTLGRTVRDTTPVIGVNKLCCQIRACRREVVETHKHLPPRAIRTRHAAMRPSIRRGLPLMPLGTPPQDLTARACGQSRRKRLVDELRSDVRMCRRNVIEPRPHGLARAIRAPRTESRTVLHARIPCVATLAAPLELSLAACADKTTKTRVNQLTRKPRMRRSQVVLPDTHTACRGNDARIQYSSHFLFEKDDGHISHYTTSTASFPQSETCTTPPVLAHRRDT